MMVTRGTHFSIIADGRGALSLWIAVGNYVSVQSILSAQHVNHIKFLDVIITSFWIALIMSQDIA
jgi:hypothetical protein